MTFPTALKARRLFGLPLFPGGSKRGYDCLPAMSAGAGCP